MTIQEMPEIQESSQSYTAIIHGEDETPYAVIESQELHQPTINPIDMESEELVSINFKP